jgi:tricorn protease
VTLGVAWSPDSKWLTYSKFLENHLRSIFVYSLDTGKVAQITEGLGDARYPVFDKSGKEIFFAASTDLGLSSGWLDLSSYQHPVLRSVYAAVLKKGDKSPVEPQSDEEKVGDQKPDEKKDEADKGKDADKAKTADKGKDTDKKDADKEKKEEPAKTTIDLDGIEQRIVALPIKPANYVGLDAGKAGVLFLSEVPDVPRFAPMTPGTVTKFDLTTRKTEPFLSGVDGFSVSATGEKVLYKQGKAWFIAAAGAAPKPGEGGLKLDALEVLVDPRVEWNQMYREVWRIERDFLYDPGHHGLPALPERFGRPSRSQLPIRRDAGRNHHRPHVHSRWRRSRSSQSERWIAGRRLQNRKWALPVCENLQRRKLESRFARAPYATRRRRESRRIFAGSEWR